MIDFIQDLAKQAGNVLLSHFGQDKGLIKQRSTVKDAATKYDKMVDEMIIQTIRERYPDHGLLTEESGSLEGNPDWLWIVDSLDGTSDFASSNPLFSVCLAVMHQGELILGTIYAPAINELYLAEKGNGAYLNGTRIHVSETGDLRQSYVFYCEGGEKDRQITGNIFNKVYPEVIDMRKLGSAGLETAWVAAGKGEAYFTTKIEPWDVAPGVLLVREAGGKVTDFTGNEWQLRRDDLVFSNGKVHSSLLGLLQQK